MKVVIQRRGQHHVGNIGNRLIPGSLRRVGIGDYRCAIAGSDDKGGVSVPFDLHLSNLHLKVYVAGLCRRAVSTRPT